MVPVAENDMYGHPIHRIGDSAYGVSVAVCASNNSPSFAVFREDDGFRQALVTVSLWPDGSISTSPFRDRLREAREALDAEPGAGLRPVVFAWAAKGYFYAAGGALLTTVVLKLAGVL